MQTTAILPAQRNAQDSQSVRSSLTCDICPHYCNIEEGSFGKCRVIKNDGARLKNAFGGYCSHISVESIEKRPLFHFMPGHRFLSVGFYGCNFSCAFCQNFTVSQTSGEEKQRRYYSPATLVKLAKNKKTSGIAFTYNEPTIYNDYVQKVGHEINRDQNPLKLVLKTNGFARPAVIRDLCLYADAINVDIKGNDEDYQKTCGATLAPVLDSVELIAKMKVHLEISYLVLPERLYDIEFNLGIRDWLASLNANIPVHLLYFYPFYEMKGEQSYAPTELVRLWKIFKEKLNHVYISNRFDSELMAYRHTKCSKCKSILVSRNSSTSLNSTTCCRKSLFGVFE